MVEKTLRPFVAEFHIPTAQYSEHEKAEVVIEIKFAAVIPAHNAAHAKRLVKQTYPDATKVKVTEGVT